MSERIDPAAAGDTPAAAANGAAAAGKPSSTSSPDASPGTSGSRCCGMSPQAPPNVGGPEAGVGRPRRPLARRVATIALAVVAVLAALVGTLYAFGGPERVADSDVATYEATVPEPNQAPEQAVLGVPGCTCHSDDPTVRAEHSRYRMRDCGNCHGGGAPIPGR